MSKGDQTPSPASSEETAEFHRILSENLMRLEKLCKGLEAVADGLPTRVDIAHCNRIAGELMPTVKTIHEFEEKRLFPHLLQHSNQTQSLSTILERLRFEHWEDQAYAEEVQHALEIFAKAPGQSNVESLSWMLRGFFEGVRRHVAFERAYVLPLVAA